MRKNVFANAIALILILSLFVIKTANAQEISSEKKELITELLQLSGQKNVMQASVDAMISQVNTSLYSMIASAPATQEEKEKMKETTDRVSKRFQELIKERGIADQALEQITIPLYDKYFTSDEIKDFIVFYSSPTGEKSIQVMPQMLQESMQRTNEMFSLKLKELMNEAIEEEKEGRINP